MLEKKMTLYFKYEIKTTSRWHQVTVLMSESLIAGAVLEGGQCN